MKRVDIIRKIAEWRELDPGFIGGLDGDLVATDRVVLLRMFGAGAGREPVHRTIAEGLKSFRTVREVGASTAGELLEWGGMPPQLVACINHEPDDHNTMCWKCEGSGFTTDDRREGNIWPGMPVDRRYIGLAVWGCELHARVEIHEFVNGLTDDTGIELRGIDWTAYVMPLNFGQIRLADKPFIPEVA